jgi:cytochrome c1
MRRNVLWGISVVPILLLAVLLGGCGSSNKQGGPQVTQVDLVNAIKLGNVNCLQCHNAGKDITMVNDLDTRTIGLVWQDSLHNGAANCEDCHGGGEFHWGLGPLAFPVPDYKVCSGCHSGAKAANLGLNDKSSFVGTDHANTNHIPDSIFSQIPTNVSKGQHIEECSVCHNSNQRFVYDNAGNLLKPDPNNLPSPSVSCANCHDGHQVAKSDPNFDNGDYQIFRKVQVDVNGANDANNGTWQRPRMYRDDLDNPTANSYPLDANGKRELNIETLCASCHTVGKYKFSKNATHQTNVFGQWQNSAHSTRSDPAWAEFSANPPAFTNPNTGVPYPVGTHATTYPYDMSNSGSKDFACKKCHNGISSIDHQENVQGTANGRIVWGDEPATCITCHDAHPRTDLGSTVNDINVRKPVVMTNYASKSATFSGNVFLDNTPVPAEALSATSVICIFCHQGRESGFTLYKTKLAPGTTITGNFFNSHYLGTAAMLWGVNGYEFTGRSYGANAAHQGANCATCHMANPTDDNLAGGHTWERNVATCNTSTCHGGFGPIPAVAGTVTPDLSTYRASFDTNNYSGDAGGAAQGIADAVRSLQQKLIVLLAAQTPSIIYNDLLYPYFFTDSTFATSFTAWTPAAYKAAFNLSFVVKGLPSAATSQANVPNGSAAVHDHIYNIQLLQDSIANLIPVATLNANTNIWSGTGGVIDGAFRPAGTRPATVYGAGQ